MRVGAGGGGELISCMAVVVCPYVIDPSIPTMPGRSTSGFIDQEGITCTKREAP